MYKYEYFFLFDEIQNQNEIMFFIYFFFKKTKWQELRNLPLPLFFLKWYLKDLISVYSVFSLKKFQKNSSILVQ